MNHFVDDSRESIYARRGGLEQELIERANAVVMDAADINRMRDEFRRRLSHKGQP